MPHALVSDFDGTITDHDFFALIAERHMPLDAPDFFALYREGHMTHVEAMQGFFRYTPSDPELLESILRDTKPDPGLRDSIELLRRGGWELIVVSAGSSWYIRRIFERLGIEAMVYASSGEMVPGKGLQIDITCDIDKSEVVRAALARFDRVAFAGDGPPDVAASLLVPGELRFARRYLAQELTRRREAFRPFTRWRDIVDALV